MAQGTARRALYHSRCATGMPELKARFFLARIAVERAAEFNPDGSSIRIESSSCRLPASQKRDRAALSRAQRTLASEQHQHFEESRAGRAPGDGHARRVNQRAGLQSARGRRVAQRGFHRALGERLDRRAAPRRAPRCARRVRARDEMLLDGRGLVCHRLAQQRLGLLDEVREPFRARAQQFQQPSEGVARSATSGMRRRARRRRAAAARRAASSRRVIRPMYWPFIQSSFSVLNTALPPLMPSSAKLSISSAFDISSRSSPGDQPRSARKLTMAAGK